MGIGEVPLFVQENLTPERIRDLAMITVQKLEENLQGSPKPSRKGSLSIMTDNGEISSQAFSLEAQAGGHTCRRLQGP